MLSPTDHLRGWVAAMMRLNPPAIESQDYRDGYRAGVRHRLWTCQDELSRLGVDIGRIPFIDS